ncbi:hypothetical protein Emed_007654 [Eimeria media]
MLSRQWAIHQEMVLNAHEMQQACIEPSHNSCGSSRFQKYSRILAALFPLGTAARAAVTHEGLEQYAMCRILKSSLGASFRLKRADAQ